MEEINILFSILDYNLSLYSNHDAFRVIFSCSHFNCKIISDRIICYLTENVCLYVRTTILHRVRTYEDNISFKQPSFKNFFFSN